MDQQINSSRERKEQVFRKLRREILAARLKVTLDEQLNRETSPTVKRLSEMKLPAIAKPADVTVRVSSNPVKPRSGGKVHYSVLKPQPKSQSPRHVAS